MKKLEELNELFVRAQKELEELNKTIQEIKESITPFNERIIIKEAKSVFIC